MEPRPLHSTPRQLGRLADAIVVAGDASALRARSLLPTTASPSPDAPTGTPGSLDVAAVLLVVQAGLGLVAAASVLLLTVLAGGAPLFVVASVAALAGPVLAVLLARGLTRCRRWARNGAVAYQALILIGSGVRFFFDGSVALGLVVTLSSVVLPLAVCALVLSPGARHAVAATRRRSKPPTALPVPRPLRPVA